jgi:hypothetical protein
VTGTHTSHVLVENGHYHQYQSNRHQALCSQATQVLHMFSGAQLPHETETRFVLLNISSSKITHIATVCFKINISEIITYH